MSEDGVGILPLLTLLLAGGVISYLGDIAGRRFARSRRRLFGLRPKHASALWAGIVGVVVATFVFALLVAVSEDFRTAVFQINLIRQERQDALAETELVNRRLGIIQERFSSLEQELAAATAKLAESRAEVASLESARDVLSLQIAGLEAQVADLFGQITALEGERDGLRDDLAARTLQVTELTLREAGLLGSVDDLEGRLARLEEEVAETTARNLELNRENLLVLASLQASEATRTEGTILVGRRQELYRILLPAGTGQEEFLANAFLGIEEELVDVGLSLGLETPAGLARAAMGSKGPGTQFLRVMSATNAFAGDAVELEMVWVPVRKVFEEGEVVARAFMRQPGDVEKNLRFLEEEFLPVVRDLAERRGILPDRLTQQYLQVTVATLIATAQQMSSYPDGVTVLFRTVSPVYNFETLTQSRFEILLEE